MYTREVDRKNENVKSIHGSKEFIFNNKTESSHIEYNTKFDQKLHSIETQFDFSYLNNRFFFLL